MSDFQTVTHCVAQKHHRCYECGGGIAPTEVYEKTVGTWDGNFSTFKVCNSCEQARDWLIEETDWPDDIDGDGHQWFFGQLREHLIEQARHGDRRFALRAYRHLVGMNRRRAAYREAYNAETVRLRDMAKGGAA